MATAIRVEALPARLGDCLLVECLRDGARPWRMLVDGGPPDTWPTLQARLQRLAPNDRRLDVAVITHVDSDHIGGMIPFLTSRFADDVGDFWFNGASHLPGHGATRSIEQGQSVVAALLGRIDGGLGAAGATGASRGDVRPWNETFARGAIDTGEPGGFLEVAIPDGPTVTVLSPTIPRLKTLARVWAKVVAAAQHGPSRDLTPDVLAPLDDLDRIAAEKTPKDGSIPNGSSIALLVEHRGASVILAGDAFGTVLAPALEKLAASRGVPALHVDAFKLPHHGSRGNVLAALVKAAPARHYIVSTNGDVFHHPDDAAIARVVVEAPTGATLWFNYRTDRTARWDDPALRKRYGHTAAYPDPGSPEAGVVLDLPARH